jgi:hypothetical protein
MSNEGAPSARVVREVPAHEGVDPSRFEPPLQEVIDAEAINTLFRSPDDPSATVEFTYCETTVSFDGSGRTEVVTSKPIAVRR